MLKYQPKSKDKLAEQINDENIHLENISTSLIIDMSKLFYNSERGNFQRN